jgi:hypothetical protein
MASLVQELFLTINYARIAQLVEHDLAKVGVASSSLVSRSFKGGPDGGIGRHQNDSLKIYCENSSVGSPSADGCQGRGREFPA